jgi:hypothetical protein
MQVFYKPGKLFNVDANPKTIKGQKYGFKTLVLYLAPHTLSGFNVCPMAEIAQCVKACLNTAGNPAYAEMKRKGRLNKTKYFLEDRNNFMLHLAREIALEKSKASEYQILVRLNGTSDIRWELESIIVDDKTGKKIGKNPGKYDNLMSLFPEVQFYDYTKIANRHSIPANYDLTFSYSGVLGYQKYVSRAIESGMRIAVVFRDKKAIPDTFLGLRCVDGDDSDIRHLDPRGVIVALYAKGAAKKDTSGFVIDTPKRVFQLLPA